MPLIKTVEEQHKQELFNLFGTYIAPLLQLRSKDYTVVNTLDGKKYSKYKGTSFDAQMGEDKKYKILTTFTDSNISKAVRAIWQQLFSIHMYAKDSGKIINTYKDSLYDGAYVWGIAQWLGGGSGSENTIYSILRQFMSWAMKTYEGNNVSFGVVIDTIGMLSKDDNKTSDINIVDFLNHDAAACVADGMNTYMIVSKEGQIQGVSDRNVPISDKPILSPIVFEKVCGLCVQTNVGICLSPNGDIYCFKKEQLRIARINGKWIVFSYESFCDVLKENNIADDNLLKEVYNTCLDVSFARTGGSIAICEDNDDLRGLLPDIQDLIKKFPLLKIIQNQDFVNLARLVRREYLAIDGVTILSTTGKVLYVGAIINSVEPTIDGGARKAAAEKLSTFGIAIKISADGYIQMIKNKKLIKEFK